MGMLIIRPPGGVHRRPDGRANAGVPRQEDPGGRDEARRALHPGHAARDAGRSPRASVLLEDRGDTYQPGPHGLTEMLYAFTSAANNNGSAFAYQGTGTQWYTTTLGICDADRPVLPDHPGAGHRRLAGRASRRCRRPAARFPTDTPLFGGLRGRRRRHRRRPDLLPGPRARARSSSTSSTREELDDHNVATTRPPSRATAEGAHARRPASKSIFDPAIVTTATVDAFMKLNPRTMMRNPVMFVVEVGSVLTTILFFRDFGDSTAQQNVFAGLVAAWLWFTVLFANFAEAMAEGPRQGPGRHAAQDAGRDDRHGSGCADGTIVEKSSSAARPRRPVRRRPPAR